MSDAIEQRDKLEANGWDNSIVHYKNGKYNENRYIVLRKGAWQIVKTVNGVKTYYGSFRTLDEAKQERIFWESIDWDFDNIDLH